MKQSTIILVVAVILALLASFAAGGLIAQRYYERALKQADTVYIEKWLPQPVPEPHDSIIVKWKTVPLPVHDTTTVHDTTEVHDSVLVEVPITEKTYIADDYKAVVRGFQPELVDMWIKQKETIINIPYRKKWSFAVGPQVGVGITPKGWQPYAGAGITFGYSF